MAASFRANEINKNRIPAAVLIDGTLKLQLVSKKLILDIMNQYKNFIN